MKPDNYMPFYGNEFFSAMRGFDDIVVLAYLRAIWFYWSHTHCEGIKDDMVFMRRICEVDKSDWENVRDIVFDNADFFTIGEDGLWHQKRARAEWDRAMKQYQAKVESGRKGGLAKARINRRRK